MEETGKKLENDDEMIWEKRVKVKKQQENRMKKQNLQEEELCIERGGKNKIRFVHIQY